MIRCLALPSLVSLTIFHCFSSVVSFVLRPKYPLSIRLSSSLTDSTNYQVNEFFKRPVPEFVKSYLTVQQQSSLPKIDTTATDFVTLAKAPPQSPGSPRPLWLVMAASIPTGLVWYGYYKFCVEEDLLQHELDNGKMPRGFGGYGTLGPFCYGFAHFLSLQCDCGVTADPFSFRIQLSSTRHCRPSKRSRDRLFPLYWSRTVYVARVCHNAIVMVQAAVEG
jgi:hypothetical protein